MTKVGLLVCGAFSDKIAKKYDGVYEDFFIQALGLADPSLSFQSYWVFEDRFPESVDECDAWLITGSANGVYEDIGWIKRLLDFTRDIYAAQKPLIGICFGHQVVAQALGGHVEKAQVGWGLGFQRYELLEPVGEIEGPYLDLHAIHQDQVVKCPSQARVIARTAHCPIAALRYEGKAVSFQPHPEFSREFEADLIESISGEKFPHDFARRAIASMQDKEVHNVQSMAFLADFLKG